MTKTKINSVPYKELQIKQLQTSLKKRWKECKKKTILKKTRINTIKQKLITIQQNYKHNIKEVTKLQDAVKRVNNEKEGERKMFTAEIDNNIKKIKSIDKDKTDLQKAMQ